ncbi:MAG: transglutaminase-like domain-containing protein, partial [Deltaproteobacteria bacterium]
MFKKIIVAVAITLFVSPAIYAKERQGEITFEINIEAPENSTDVKLWLPYPASDKEQTIEDVKIDGNFSNKGVYSQKEEKDLALYAEWTKPLKERTLKITFKAKAIERSKNNFPQKESDIPAEIKEYVNGSQFIPIDGKIKEIATGITKGNKGVRKKAEAVYDWVIENTFRDPDIKGCGTGDVERIIAEKSGKCADISGVFVALARAAGV